MGRRTKGKGKERGRGEGQRTRRSTKEQKRQAAQGKGENEHIDNEVKKGGRTKETQGEARPRQQRRSEVTERRQGRATGGGVEMWKSYSPNFM